MLRPCVAILGLGVFACAVKFEAGPGFRCDDGVSCPLRQVCLGGHCVDPDLGDGGDLGGPAADAVPGFDPPWWDQAWAFRRPLTIRNGSGEVIPAGYELRWYYDITPFTPPPSDPLRIVRWDGADWSEKDRVLDDFADMAQLEEEFFFALDEELVAGETNRQYWLYYENPGAGRAPASPEQVFTLFYEGFHESTLDPSRWAVQGAPTTVNSELVLGPGDSIRSLATWGPGFALDVRHRRPDAANDSSAGFQRSADFVNDAPWILWIDWEGDGAVTPDSKLPALNDTMSTTGPAVTPGTAERLYTIERFSDRIVYDFEGLRHDERILPGNDDEPLQIRLNNGSAGATLFFPTVRIRRIVDPEPEIVLGAPEARP